MNTEWHHCEEPRLSAGELLIRPTGCVRPAPLTLLRASPTQGSRCRDAREGKGHAVGSLAPLKSHREGSEGTSVYVPPRVGRVGRGHRYTSLPASDASMTCQGLRGA